MAKNSDEREKWAMDVITGKARGVGPTALRFFLRGVSVLYKAGVKTRLRLYRKGWKEQHDLGTIVVSIGNLTMGGTGKTPVVERLARQLTERGRKVAILSRGYKSAELKKPQNWIHPETGDQITSPPKIVSDGFKVHLKARYAGDEPYMLAKNLPGVAVVVDKDRVRGGRFAVDQLGCDTLLLDDGMQYLNISHALDIVLVDQGTPFGIKGIIPRGTLREPPKNLCRADYVLITKCDGSSNKKLRKRISKLNPTAEVLECTHGPKHVQGVFHDEVLPLESMDGKYVAAISGIAMPKSFDNLLKKMGAKVLFHTTFADHHAFSQDDIDRFMRRCVDRGVEMIITTEKDAVRFPVPSEADVPVYYLRIEVKILENEEVWERCVDRICQRPNKEAPDWAEERLLEGDIVA